MKINFNEFTINVTAEDAFDSTPDIALRAFLVRLSNNLYVTAKQQEAQGLRATARETWSAVQSLWDAIDTIPDPYKDPEAAS